MRKVVVVGKEGKVQQLAGEIGWEVLIADDPAEALDIIRTSRADLVLFDCKFTPDHIKQFLDGTDKNETAIAVVVVGSEESDTAGSAEFLRIGVLDYLCGDEADKRLKEIANRIENRSAAESTDNSTRHFFVDDFAALISMVGRSQSAHSTLEMIKLVGRSRCNPVLIIGETGTGKEVAATAIHVLRHPNERFVPVNCAALTANLLESELFGHIKGSFTGADRDKTGLLETAGAGTIFLDEISEMPLELQAKLLRVVQEKTFRKVGGIESIKCNATIIASSNRNLKNEIQARRFRQDLYYRLNVCPIVLAPLRSPKRRKDIQILADYFLHNSTINPEKQNKITSLTKLAIEDLQKHDWPGNVRELRNVIERAILFEKKDKIALSSIVIDPAEPTSDGSETERVKDLSLAKAERKLIAKALRETGWQKTRAAALLGITRATLYAKVKQYNIKKGTTVEASPEEVASTFSSEPEKNLIHNI